MKKYLDICLIIQLYNCKPEISKDKWKAFNDPARQEIL